MNTGYSIFGGPVEAMDGAVRAVSIMPHYRAVAGFGADVVGVAAPPPPPHGGLRVRAVHQQFGPQHPSRIPPPMAHPGGLAPWHPAHAAPPGAMVPGPRRPAPGGMVPGRYPGQPMHPYVPHQTLPMPVRPPPIMAQPPCACPMPPPPPPCPGVPMGPPPQFHYYNPTPSSPLCPGSMVPYPDRAMQGPCGTPMGAHGEHLWHPGGMYPITMQGPGLQHPNMGILKGQLPVGAGVDIFGAQVSVENPTQPRPIGPGCQPQPVAQAGTCQPRPQPQMAYNQGARGVFGARAGVFGASPDGLGGWR